MRLPHALVDVFTDTAFAGNPLAVVGDATTGAQVLDGEQMMRICRWFNLSETTFLLPPTLPDADYRVRIFTPERELPFAGHPTLGTAQVWLDSGGTPARDDVVVQECGAGLVTVRRAELGSDVTGLAFAAPPLVRGGQVGEEDLARACEVLRISREAVVRAAWVDNGPGWLGIQLADAPAVLDVRPVGSTDARIDLGVVGLHDGDGLVGVRDGDEGVALEVRAFFSDDQLILREDPVTGSLNASVAQWLVGEGVLSAPYLAAQGTAIGRSGRIHVTADDGGQLWIGGAVTAVSRGTLEA